MQKHTEFNPIFFSWRKILKISNITPNKILDIFSEISSKGVVPKYLTGNSFILNISDLITSNYYMTEKFDYITLAAVRNYFDYEYQNESGLWLPYTDIDIVKIQNNRLLQIKNNYIRFKYEEI